MTPEHKGQKSDIILERLRQRPFEVYFITHSHIDIGYTHRQEEIEDFQRQFIGQALAMATSPRQQDRPDDLKFRFTCEGFWAVEKFLAAANSSERERFEQAIHDGLIELSASYFHLTELLDGGHLRDTLNPAMEYAREIGTTLEYAGAFDVNGFSWGYCDALADAGLKYFSTCINTHHGGRPFNKRNVPFWWRGPAGGRILTWEGQTYHKANLYGLVPLSDSASAPAFPVGDLAAAERIFLPRLSAFRDEGYDLDFFPLFAGGLYTDNSPPTDVTSEHLAAWNDAYGDVCFIRAATMKQFFARLEAEAASFPECRGDWPDWWADGVASTAHETALFRNAQRAKREVERLDPQHRVVTPTQLDEIRRNLWHYAEHTWGHSHAVPLPWNFLSQQMLQRKGEYAVAADRLAMTAMDQVLKMHGAGDFVAHRPRTYRVLNTTGEAKAGLALLPLDFWEASILRAGVKVIDRDGRTVTHQVRPSPRGSDLAVAVALEADGVLQLEIVDDVEAEAHTPFVPRWLDEKDFETADLTLSWEIGRGILALIDRVSGVNYAAAEPYPLAAPVYQVFPSDAQTPPQQVRSQAGIAKEKPASRESVGSLTGVELLEDGPLLRVLSFHYEVEGASMYRVNVSLPMQGRWMGLEACLNKDNIWDPEGIYLAFSLGLDGGQWHLDRAGGPMRPGVDQLPYTCRDYYMVQEGAVLENGSVALALSLIDTPLIHLGGLNLWNYGREGVPDGPLLSWQTNNKWETNFKGYCGGFYGFRYHLDLDAPAQSVEASIARLRANAVPLRVVRM